MKREVLRTEDGSTTFRLPEWDECYHSKHGAIQEAYHVFIKNGLSLFQGKPVSILEIGFGTGLNAFITYLEAERDGQQIHYCGVEGFPLSAEDALQMNYVIELEAEAHSNIFEKMHACQWNSSEDISDNFKLRKVEMDFKDITYKNEFDLIYFDAFGFRVQPELWSTRIFQIMYDALKKGGVLVTYAARGDIKRSMIEVGFKVEKLAGPPGKREMMRAYK